MRVEQKIFRAKTVGDLQAKLKEHSGVERYLESNFSETEIGTLSFHFESDGVQPALDPSRSDFENARPLYEYYRHLTPVQASDPRLWSYLCHVTHRSYVQARWPDLEDILNAGGPQPHEIAGRYLTEKWFTGSSARSLRRNSLAGLWWPIYLTAMPEGGWPEEYAFLPSDDEYAYTRPLFDKTDLQLNLLDRRTGWSRKIILPVLETLRQKPDILASRAAYRRFIVETNLMMSYRKLGSMSPSKVFSAVLRLAEDLQDDN